MMDAWGETWPWHVVVLDGDGEQTAWRCNTRDQANRECDAILDSIMSGGTDIQAAWVAEVR